MKRVIVFKIGTMLQMLNSQFVRSKSYFSTRYVQVPIFTMFVIFFILKHKYNIMLYNSSCIRRICLFETEMWNTIDVYFFFIQFIL